MDTSRDKLTKLHIAKKGIPELRNVISRIATQKTPKEPIMSTQKTIIH